MEEQKLDKENSDTSSNKSEKLILNNDKETQNKKEDYIKTFQCQKIPKSILNDKEIISIINNPVVINKSFFEGKYVLYEIITESQNWLVKRRYSDFIWLRECLRMLFPAELIPSLPKKKLGNRRFDEDFINKRMEKLQNFLNSILKNENFKSCSPLILFLSLTNRNQFEERMNQIIPAPFPSIDTLMNFEGNVKILDFENNNFTFKDSFYTNINKYFKIQNNCLKDLNKNLKSYFEYINMADNCLAEVQTIFEKLRLLSEQAQISQTITKVYEEYENFYKNYPRIQNNQAFVINTATKGFFKSIYEISDPFIELLDQQEEVKKEYIGFKNSLLNKKENLWKNPDISKWNIDYSQNVDNNSLFTNKEYAFSKMCNSDNINLNKIYSKLGYFYYYNKEQFNTILNDFNNKFKINLKDFTDQLQPTITDLVQIYTSLATCSF